MIFFTRPVDTNAMSLLIPTVRLAKARMYLADRRMHAIPLGRRGFLYDDRVLQSLALVPLLVLGRQFRVMLHKQSSLKSVSP